MPYRTRLVLTGGDKRALEAAVADIRAIANRKGAHLAGPHTQPTREIDVPLYKVSTRRDTFGTWRYAIYRQQLEVTGHESVARSIAERSFHPSIDISLTIENVETPHQRR